MTQLLKQSRGAFIVLQHECSTIGRMNIRMPHPVQVLALCAAVVRGLAEFVSLQRWRLRERRSR